MFKAARPSWSGKCSRDIVDITLYQNWQAAGTLVPGWILIPISWRCVVEILPRTASGSNPKKFMLREMMDLVANRDRSGRYKYAMLMMQSNPLQAGTVARSKRVGWEGNLNDVFGADVTIFDSRLQGLFWAARGDGRPPFPAEMVPVPLLRPHVKAAQRMRVRQGTPHSGVFWAGLCHNSGPRYLLASTLHPSALYNFSGVHKCKRKPPSEFSEGTFMAQVSAHAWTLAPRGTYPAAFAMAETLALRRLPVYIADFKAADSKERKAAEANGGMDGLDTFPHPIEGRVVDGAEMTKYFPYADVLDWTKLAVAIDVSQLDQLGGILEAKEKELPDMLAYVAEKGGMFTTKYLGTYMEQWMMHHQPK